MEVMWQAIIAGAILLGQAAIAAVVTIWTIKMQQQTKQAVIRAGKSAKRNAKNAAVEVEGVKVEATKTADKVQEVKEVLKEDNALIVSKVDSLAKVADAIHTLTNSNMGEVLRLNAELSRWKANQTNLKPDLDAAESSERLYREHQDKQGVVDIKDAKDAKGDPK